MADSSEELKKRDYHRDHDRYEGGQGSDYGNGVRRNEQQDDTHDPTNEGYQSLPIAPGRRRRALGVLANRDKAFKTLPLPVRNSLFDEFLQLLVTVTAVFGDQFAICHSRIYLLITEVGMRAP